MAQPPVLMKPIPSQTLNEGGTFKPLNLTHYIQSPDPESGSTRFSVQLASGAELPQGLKYTSDGIIQGIPAPNTQGSYDVVVFAENESDIALRAQFQLVIKESIARDQTDLQTIMKHARIEGLDTVDILAALLKLQYDANTIPSDDPSLLVCLWLKYSLTRNEFLDGLLEPLIFLDESVNRINASLGILEKVEEGKLSVPTFAKELGSLKDILKKLKENREQTLSDYDVFIRERDQVIAQVIQRILKVVDQPERLRLSQDQVVRNEFNRIEKTRKDFVFKLQKFAREKEGIRIRLVDLFNKTQERMPAEKRISLPTAIIPTNPTQP